MKLIAFILYFVHIKQFGMSCALETQCGQAYGAKQYKKFGVHIYTAIISLIIACVLLSLLWLYLGKLLSLLGQDPLISQEAGKFVMCRILLYLLMQHFRHWSDTF